MTDVQAPPVPGATGNASRQPKNQRSATNPQGQAKRNNRSRNAKNQSSGTGMPHVDGAMSDSYAVQTLPRSRKSPRQQAMQINGQPLPKYATAKQQRPVSSGRDLAPATPAKEQAYAGPTFQASPAPSSLPVPKFFSRSVPNAAVPNSMQARMAGDRTPEQVSSPEADTVSPMQPARDTQSPLDMFFKADREEKEKRRSAGNLLSPQQGPTRPARVPATEPFDRYYGKHTFMSELDGQDSDELSSPMSQIRRPHFERAHSSPGQSPALQNGDMRDTYTRSLRDMLFSSGNTSSIGPAELPANQPAELPAVAPQSHSGSSNPLQTPSPATSRQNGSMTPQSLSEQQRNYALHYGNRDLSPLSKAARNETPSRPSSLRQEIPFEPPDSSREYPQSNHRPSVDATSFSRNFLEQQIRNSPQPQPNSGYPYPRQHDPNNLFQPNSPFGGNYAGSGLPSSRSTETHEPSAASPRAPVNTTSTNGSRDIGAMEDDLRRMLKLNVMG